MSASQSEDPPVAGGEVDDMTWSLWSHMVLDSHFTPLTCTDFFFKTEMSYARSSFPCSLLYLPFPSIKNARHLKLNRNKTLEHWCHMASSPLLHGIYPPPRPWMTQEVMTLSGVDHLPSL